MRLALYDSHRAVRDMLRLALIFSQPCRHQIVAEGGTGSEAIATCLHVRPELILLDVMFPDRGGMEVLMTLRRQLRGLRVIFFTGCLHEPVVCQALALGAAGYVSKSSPLQTLLDAIDRVAAGQRSFDPLIAHLVDREPPAGDWQVLTPREREAVQLITGGKSTKEAAVALGVSTKTLDKHRTRAMKKLHLHDVVSLTRYALMTGLTSLS